MAHSCVCAAVLLFATGTVASIVEKAVPAAGQLKCHSVVASNATDTWCNAVCNNAMPTECSAGCKCSPGSPPPAPPSTFCVHHFFSELGCSGGEDSCCNEACSDAKFRQTGYDSGPCPAEYSVNNAGNTTALDKESYYQCPEHSADIRTCPLTILECTMVEKVKEEDGGESVTIQGAAPPTGCDGFPCSYSKQDCCPNASCQHAGPPTKVGDKGICHTDSPAPVYACGNHPYTGCAGSCSAGGDCGIGSDGECQCVLPPPPADSWKCISGQCQNVVGGIDKGSCLAACAPSDEQYSCIDNQCQVVKQGGVAKSVCEGVCGPSLREVKWLAGV